MTINDAEIARLRSELAAARTALRWCSGSADFNEGGRAYAGWQKVCAPLLEEVVFHPLVETLADVMAAGLKADLSGEEIAQDVLAAIDASGTHKVIPVWLWDDMRDAYLAEQKDGREVAQPPAPVGGGLP